MDIIHGLLAASALRSGGGVMDAIFNPFTASTFGLVGGAVCIVLFVLVRARRKREEAAMEDWEDLEE